MAQNVGNLALEHSVTLYVMNTMTYNMTSMSLSELL